VDVADRIAHAYGGFWRERGLASEGGEVEHVDGLTLAFTNIPDASLNVAFVEASPADPAGALAAAEDAFRRRGLGFGIEVETGRHPRVEEAVHAAGLVRVETRPAMVASIGALAMAEEVPGFVVTRVREPSTLREVARVDAAAYEGDVDISTALLPPGLLARDDVAVFIAHDGDRRPVGEASAWLLDGSVGVFGVGVVEASRGLGLGAALTLLAALAFGDAADLAWLLPSDRARPMYERLGFRPVSTWEVWVRR
jgi:GNAT superfamily N-acetyltransferase